MNVKKLGLFLLLISVVIAGTAFAQVRGPSSKDGVTATVLDSNRHTVRIVNMNPTAKTVILEVHIGITSNGRQSRKQVFQETITVQAHERNKVIVVGNPLNSSRGVSSLGGVRIINVY